MHLIERKVTIVSVSILLFSAIFFSVVFPTSNFSVQKIMTDQKVNSEPHVSTLVSNQLLGYYNTSTFAGDAVLIADYVFVASEGGGLHVLDITNPTLPVNVGIYKYGASIYRIVVKDDLAYLSCGPDGLQIVNISNPLSVDYVSHLNWTFTQYPESTAQMEVVGNYLYVCDVHDDFKVVNVTDPYNPTMIGSCFFSSSALGIAIKDNFAYIGAWNNRLVTINITDPTNPQVTASNYIEISYAIGVQIKDNLVYVADWENGLHIFDLTTPATPTYIKTFSMTKLRDITILYDYAFVADSDRGLQVFNLTDPLNPYIINTFSNAGYTSRAVAYDDYVLVANGLSGLLIYDTDEVLIAPLPTTPPDNTTPTFPFGNILSSSIFLLTLCFTTYLIFRKKRK